MASSVQWIAVVAIDARRMPTDGRQDFASGMPEHWNCLGNLSKTSCRVLRRLPLVTCFQWLGRIVRLRWKSGQRL
jgi:hypothetical protein